MLKHRLEKIAECAALETSSLEDDDDDIDDDVMESSAKREGHSASGNDDDLPAVGSTPELIPSSEHATDLEEDWEELEQSAIRLNIDDDNSCNVDELLAIRSAPTLTQGEAEQCQHPSTILSHSAHHF
jgi:hypothetical protein